MEKITINVRVNGFELPPIDMGEGKQDPIYEDDIYFYKSGNLGLEGTNRLPYQYNIRISRHKTDSEKKGGTK